MTQNNNDQSNPSVASATSAELGLLKYWKKRCLAAEKYIKESPCDPDIFPKQLKAYQNWQRIVKNEVKP